MNFNISCLTESMSDLREISTASIQTNDPILKTYDPIFQGLSSCVSEINESIESIIYQFNMVSKIDIDQLERELESIEE